MGGGWVEATLKVGYFAKVETILILNDCDPPILQLSRSE